MWRFALRTVRARTSAYLATAGVVIAGTALLTAFAALVETGVAGGQEALGTLAAIMGGWTTTVVAFGVVSTVALVVQQRERELALLRSIGATAGQVRSTVLAETIAVALPAVAVGVLPGVGLGHLLLAQMTDLGVVPVPLALATSWRTLLAGAAVALLSAVVAALVAGRRAAAGPVLAVAENAEGLPGAAVVSRSRWAVGTAFVVAGLGCALGTLAMENGPLLAAAAGPACILVAIGAALLSPAAIAVVGRAADRLPGGPTQLALRNLDARAARGSAVVGPLALMVGIAAGTLFMQSTEDSVAGLVPDPSGPQFAAANYLVIAMIVAFSVIVVTNTLVAATWHRRREFGVLRLTAATRTQVLGMVSAESAISAAIAIVLGTVAAAATAVPFSIVKTGSPIPSGPVWMYLVIAGGGLLVSFATTFSTTVRATRTRPVVAVAG